MTTPSPIELDPAGMKILGVWRSYDDLHALLRARFSELEMTCSQVDEVAGLADGHCGKLLGPAMVKTIGPKVLPLVLGGLGLALAVVEDPQATQQIRGRITPRRRPGGERPEREYRLGATALKRARPQVLSEYFRAAAKRLNASLTPEERSKRARRAANARWHGERRPRDKKRRA